MFELIVFIGIVVLMVKVASIDDQSPLLWGSITFLLGIVSMMLIPLPFINLIIALVVSFVAMFVYKIVMDRR